MNKPYVALSKAIAALCQEGLRRKARAEDILTSLLAALAKTKPPSTAKPPESTVKRYKFCNVNGHDLNNCFHTTRILRKAKSPHSQGADSSTDQPPPSNKKGANPDQLPRPAAHLSHNSAGPSTKTMKNPTTLVWR
ncbi:hypothetical protein PCANC_20535 [Puccinia coronata f. sp. avenae]|uniref:Uncharacterized protein n=1 Tax=Puccinia coronata f. sp. avenae TaxID=200324 RepID=A0A2N5SA49_9BASI|nr:hypothetical protein PCANC_20535 [Puccinia coronata f. sp. avenae]